MSNDSLMAVDHIGYAVRDMQAAKEKFEALGFTFSLEVADELRKVNVCVASTGDFRVELLAPLEGQKSPIDSYLNKIGSTPYHICYRVTDMAESITRLKEAGFTLLGEPLPSVPLHGDVCFLYANEIGLIELISYGEKG